MANILKIETDPVKGNSVKCLSPTANHGAICIKAVDSYEDFTASITNDPNSVGDVDYILPVADAGTANIVAVQETSLPLVPNSIIVADSTGGVCRGGAKLIVNEATDPGHGTTGITYYAPGIDIGYFISVSLIKSANPVSILSFKAIKDAIVVYYTADPGATEINYFGFSNSISMAQDDHKEARECYLEKQHKFYQGIKEKEKTNV